MTAQRERHMSLSFKTHEAVCLNIRVFKEDKNNFILSVDLLLMVQLTDELTGWFSFYTPQRKTVRIIQQFNKMLSSTKTTFRTDTNIQVIWLVVSI